MSIFKKSLFLLIILLTASCTFTENLEIKPDGTGNFSIEMDASGLMAMAGEKAFEGMKIKKDTKSIDSTFSFKQIFEEKKDSITKLPPEQQMALKKLEKFVMNIKMNTELKQLLFAMKTPFKSVNELDDLNENIGALKNLKESSKKPENPLAMMSGMGNTNSKLSFSYNAKSFTRKAVVSKTITIEYPLTDYKDNQDKLNLNVEFE